ncbi:cobalt transport protein [Paenibacillus alvei TS-15]|jgi:energy-coupling factor transport system permease protein|uniref:Cobalt transport protein n=1 Tax=Paenibacillus alvei TS-15 TaxID=1117108 RepID=S9U0V1_PAEAL|nr:energy-coupling factor transporter transmembrane component T [Paenibacillus alvei]EPY08091.1 cobalt transport protein [Paenibacillus alvei TS-15]
MQAKMMLGRYVAADSWIHRLDPRAKLTAMVIYLVAVILAEQFAELAALTVFALLIMISSRISLYRYFRASRPLWLIMAFMFIFYLLFDSSGSALVQVGGLKITTGGVTYGAYAVWRMALLVTLTAILTFTTAPVELNLGLERVLKPIRFVGGSPQRWSMMIGISLRFIPTIFEEAEKVMKAQASRGADYADLSFTQKGKLVMTLMVPVIVSAFRRAEELVQAMEARGYVLNAPRTSLRQLKWKQADTLFMALFIAMLVLVLLW